MRISVVFACVAVLASPAFASPKTATKAYKTLQAAALKTYRTANDVRLASAFAQLAVVELQLKSSLITGPNAVEDVVDALGPALAEISTNALVTTIDLVSDADDLLIAENVTMLPGFLPGDGGLSDQFEQKIDKELARVRGKVLKRLGQFRKSLAKSTVGVFGLAYTIPIMHVNAAPNPNNPATVGGLDAVTYPPRILIALGTSSNLLISDGRIVVGARGFVSFAGVATNFYLYGHEFRTSLNVSLPDTSGFGYSQTKFDSLDEGGYLSFVDQDPDHDTSSTEAAFERTNIGVP